MSDIMAAACSLLCLHCGHAGGADGHGDFVSILACSALTLGRVPEQVLPWRWLQVCPIQLQNCGAGGIVIQSLLVIM